MVNVKDFLNCFVNVYFKCRVKVNMILVGDPLIDCSLDFAGLVNKNN